MVDTALKRCTCPGHEGPNPLPVTEFGRRSSRADGLYSSCRQCVNRAHRAANAANPEKNRERVRRWNEAHPDQTRDKIRRHKDQLRAQVLAHYGTACACCGSTDDLTVDHPWG